MRFRRVKSSKISLPCIGILYGSGAAVLSIRLNRGSTLLTRSLTAPFLPHLPVQPVQPIQPTAQLPSADGWPTSSCSTGAGTSLAPNVGTNAPTGKQRSNLEKSTWKTTRNAVRARMCPSAVTICLANLHELLNRCAWGPAVRRIDLYCVACTDRLEMIDDLALPCQ